MVVAATPGRLTDLDDAEALLARGVAYMIGIVVGMIAEPS